MQPDENTVWPEVFSCIQHPPGIRNTLFPQFLPGCPPLALWALFSALAHLPSWAPLWMPRVFCMNRSFWFLQAMSSWPYSLPVLQDGSSAACAIPDRVLIQSQQQTGGQSPVFPFKNRSRFPKMAPVLFIAEWPAGHQRFQCTGIRKWTDPGMSPAFYQSQTPASPGADRPDHTRRCGLLRCHGESR